MFRGTGRFFTKDWTLIGFKVSEFTPLKSRDFDQLFNDIRSQVVLPGIVLPIRDENWRTCDDSHYSAAGCD